MNFKKALIILIHAFVGGGLCGATIGIGKNLTSIEITLVLHAIGAPIFFAIIALIYFKNFNLTFRSIPYIDTESILETRRRVKDCSCLLSTPFLK